MIHKEIVFCGIPSYLTCDAQCNKAWGVSSRPKVQISGDDDDYAFLADDELGDAPEDPGTYEGGYGKPENPEERLNKWCARECERSCMGPLHAIDKARPNDFSRRMYNIPESDPAHS